MTACLAYMSEAPLNQLAAPALKRLAFGSLHAGTVVMEGSVGTPASFIGETAIGLLVALRNVATNAALRDLVDGLRFVVALVRANLFDLLCRPGMVGAAGDRWCVIIVVVGAGAGAGASDSLIGSIEAVGDRGRIANCGFVEVGVNDHTGLHVHYMLCFVGQARPAVLESSDTGVFVDG